MTRNDKTIPGPADAPVLLDITDGIGRITFHRAARLNAIDVAMAEAFLAACQTLQQAGADLRVVVLAAAGKSFMAGGDLAAFRDHGAAAADPIIVPLHEGLHILAQLDAPSIAVLHGAVAGAGVGVALGADLAIAADDTTFNLAYARIGASLDGGSSWLLPRLVGLRKAIELALLAENVTAAHALRLGLVNRVVPLADLETEANRIVDRLAAGPTLAYGQIRRLLRGAFDHDLAQQLERERLAFNACARSGDFTEGIAAFFARRPPQFQGRG